MTAFLNPEADKVLRYADFVRAGKQLDRAVNRNEISLSEWQAQKALLGDRLVEWGRERERMVEHA